MFCDGVLQFHRHDHESTAAFYKKSVPNMDFIALHQSLAHHQCGPADDPMTRMAPNILPGTARRPPLAAAAGGRAEPGPRRVERLDDPLVSESARAEPSERLLPLGRFGFR